MTRPISENTLNAALRRLGYGTEEMCTHGFRGMASTRLNEMGRWNPDAIERQLAHQEANAVRRAYTHNAEFANENDFISRDHRIDHVQDEQTRNKLRQKITETLRKFVLLARLTSNPNLSKVLPKVKSGPRQL